jgi:hypothetical protein
LSSVSIQHNRGQGLPLKTEALSPFELRERLRDRLFGFWLALFTVGMCGYVPFTLLLPVVHWSLWVWMCWSVTYHVLTLWIWRVWRQRALSVTVWSWCHTVQTVYLAWGAERRYHPARFSGNTHTNTVVIGMQ